MEAAIEHQQALNRLAAGYYVSGVVGLLVVSVVVSNTNRLSTRLDLNNHHTAKAASQTLRKILAGVPVGYFLILPHWLLVALIFVGLNVGLLAWQMVWTNQAYLGSRFGWLALCNMCLVIFLGMKNTPLSPLAGQTYRDLNVLHRVCGYITVFEVILHASLFSSGLFQVHNVAELRYPSTSAGAVAGVSMLIIAITATYFFRRRLYETFFALHVFFVAVILVAMGLHKADIRERALIVVIVSAAFWLVDRAIRASRWLYYGYHGYCKLTPLSYGATKITMTRSMRARPGSHAFLWIPGISMFQHHPFTLLSTDPVELVVAARAGFTKRLYETACAQPGGRFRAMLEGPYGHAPNVHDFDKVLLLAGGSGVTFAMALVRDWLHHTALSDTPKTLHFVWVVRSTHQFLWFLPSLDRLRADPRITVVLHVTSEHTEGLADDVLNGAASSPTLSDNSDRSAGHLIHDLEKNTTTDKELAPSTPSDAGRHDSYANLLHSFNRGRPAVDHILKQAIAGSSSNDKILITGSGPDQLLTDIQASTGSAIKSDGPTIQLHLEPYEW